MYTTLLATHSLIRWLVLVSLVYSLYRAYNGMMRNKPFTGFDDKVRHITATIAHIQLIAGLWLYFISPLTTYFLQNYTSTVHVRTVRFFGMEHSTMMLSAIVVITIGSAKAKRKTIDHKKFKTIAIWYTIALVILLVNIPWPFSPFASRPWFRMF